MIQDLKNKANYFCARTTDFYARHQTNLMKVTGLAAGLVGMLTGHGELIFTGGMLAQESVNIEGSSNKPSQRDNLEDFYLK